MTDIELLPLPESLYRIGGTDNDDAWDADHMRDYARANVAHATEPLKAEIEALRDDVGTATRMHAITREHLEAAEARAERLAEAINAYKSECDNPAKDYVLRAKRRDEMFALLRDHDQEGGNP